MNLRKHLSLLTLALLVPSVVLAQESSLAVNTETSAVKWVGRKVTGSHNGFLRLKSGVVHFQDKALSGGEFVLDMATITDEDIADQEYRQKLENHLRSDDFFNVKEHPEARFVIDSVEPKGEGVYAITGNLTVKGITHPVTFDANVTEAEGAFQGNAKVTIDRSLWDIRYNSGKFFDIQKLGDKLIYDEIEIELDLRTVAGGEVSA